MGEKKTKLMPYSTFVLVVVEVEVELGKNNNNSNKYISAIRNPIVLNFIVRSMRPTTIKTAISTVTTTTNITKITNKQLSWVVT